MYVYVFLIETRQFEVVLIKCKYTIRPFSSFVIAIFLGILHAWRNNHWKVRQTACSHAHPHTVHILNMCNSWLITSRNIYHQLNSLKRLNRHRNRRHCNTSRRHFPQYKSSNDLQSCVRSTVGFGSLQTLQIQARRIFTRNVRRILWFFNPVSLIGSLVNGI